MQEDLLTEQSRLLNDIRNTESLIFDLEQKLQNFDSLVASGNKVLRDSEERLFNEAQARKISAIEKTVLNTMRQVDQALGDMTRREFQTLGRKINIDQLDTSIKRGQELDLIDNFKVMHPIIPANEQEAFKLFTDVSGKVRGTSDHDFIATFSEMSSALLMKIATGFSHGLIAVGVIAVGAAVALKVYPISLLATMSFIGVMSSLSGKRQYTLMRGLVSLKNYLSSDYDKELFKSDCAQVNDQSKQFLLSYATSLSEELSSKSFEWSPEKEEEMRQTAATQKASLTSNLAEAKRKLDILNARMSEIAGDLERLALDKRARADAAIDKYLRTIDVEWAWTDNILLDVLENDDLVIFQNRKCNSLFVSDELSYLEKFTQLFSLQVVLHSHPDITSQQLLDYTYMAGGLQTLSPVVERSFKVITEKEPLTDAITQYSEDIQSRTRSILSCADNLDQFNSIMEEYGGVGRSYMIVHIYGLKAMTPQLESLMLNGPKVGYFFKLYMTPEELRLVAQDIPYPLIPELWHVSEDLTPIDEKLLREAYPKDQKISV